MKFPRNARIFRGQLDAAPFLAVFFLLIIFVMLGSVIYTPGVLIRLPVAGEQSAGVEGPTVAVAVDANGRFYFRNQWINPDALVSRLQSVAQESAQPLTLVVYADKETRRESLDQLADIAQRAGIHDLLLGTLPRP